MSKTRLFLLTKPSVSEEFWIHKQLHIMEIITLINDIVRIITTDNLGF